MRHHHVVVGRQQADPYTFISALFGCRPLPVCAPCSGSDVRRVAACGSAPGAESYMELPPRGGSMAGEPGRPSAGDQTGRDLVARRLLARLALSLHSPSWVWEGHAGSLAAAVAACFCEPIR